MGAEYALTPISKEFLGRCESVSGKCSPLPKENKFIPKTFNLVVEKVDEQFPAPALILDTNIAKIYHSVDTQFLIPEMVFQMMIKTPLITWEKTPSIALADLYCLAAQRRLSPLFYEAKKAGLVAQLTPKENGIELKVMGFSDKAIDLLERTSGQLATFVPTVEEFDLAKERCGIEYENKGNKTVLHQGIDLLATLLYKDHATYAEKKECLNKVTFEEFSSFAQSLYKKCYLEGLFYGNVTASRAQDAATKLQGTFVKENYPIDEHYQKLVASFAIDKPPFYLTQKSKLPANCLILTLEAPHSLKNRVALELLTKGLEEPFFSELRTKQRTGYIVRNWCEEEKNRLFAFFLVQSGSHDVRDLLSRFELFFETTLSQKGPDALIGEEEFETLKQAQLVEWEHPAQSMSEMGTLLNTLAFEKKGEFDLFEKQRSALKELSYAEFIQFSNELLGRENMARAAIGITGKLSPKDLFSYRKVPSPKKARSEIIYNQ